MAFKIRPIRPEDEPFMAKFHETLSEESVYHRYFGPLKLDQRTAHSLFPAPRQRRAGENGRL